MQLKKTLKDRVKTASEPNFESWEIRTVSSFLNHLWRRDRNMDIVLILWTGVDVTSRCGRATGQVYEETICPTSVSMDQILSSGSCL